MKMERLYWILALISTSVLFSADHRISATSRERHHAMAEYFINRTPALQEQETWWDSPYMTTDWKGTREMMAKSGVTFDMAYVTDVLGNPVGGAARGFAYAGSFGVSLNVDFNRFGVTGFEFFTSATWRTGTNLSSRKIHNQFPVAQLFGSQTVRLNELYLIETLWDKRVILKAGRLDAGNDFLSSPLYWHYVSNAFDGNPIAIFFNIPFTAYPDATWGALFEFKPWQQLSTKWGVYNANSKIQQNKYHGMNFTFSSTNGVVWITEWCYLLNQQKDTHGMPGNYKAGLFYLTGSKDKFLGGSQKGDPGFYFLFDQMIYRKGPPGSQRGLTPFIALFFQPNNRNLFPFFADGGFVYQGPFEGRPKDALACGFAYGHYSTDLAKVEKRQGKRPQSAETILEINYWVQINKWFYVMPDLQYIIHPKGLNTPNALVIGAQIGLDQW